MRALNYTGPLVVLTHGVPMERLAQSVALTEQGWLSYNVTFDLRHRFMHLRGLLPANGTRVQQERPDGWATMLKLFAWNLTAYRLVLYTDLDVSFSESPERALREADEMDIDFEATPERAARGYNGLNTHLMLLRPSRAVFNMLLANALHGHFMTYTHTEQDVLETAFPPVVTGAWRHIASAGPSNIELGSVDLPKHVHAGFYWLNNTRSRVHCHNASKAQAKARAKAERKGLVARPADMQENKYQGSSMARVN